MNLDLKKFRTADGQDLFKDATEVQKKIGKANHANCVDTKLDELCAQMTKGVVFYDPQRKVILADRAALLECLYKHGAVGVPARM